MAVTQTIFGPHGTGRRKKPGFMRRIGATAVGALGGVAGSAVGGPAGGAFGSAIGSTLGEEIFNAQADRSVASAAGGFTGQAAQPRKEEYRRGRPSHPAARKSPRPVSRPRRAPRRRSAAPDLWFKPRPRQYYPRPPRTHPRRSQGQSYSPRGPRYGYPDEDYMP